MPPPPQSTASVRLEAGVCETACMVETVAHTVRVRLDIAYDGAAFHGWAIQPGLRTVQGVLEEALAMILRRPVYLTVAGRTDAGVHARGQVAHLDVPADVWAALPGRSDRRPAEALQARLFGVLGRESSGPRGTSDVVVTRVSEVPGTFDARFSALARRYSYRIETRDFDPVRRGDTLWLPMELDVEGMREAAKPLLGLHDFLSYCKPREGATTIRTLQRLDVEEKGATVIIRAQADAFCHSMVRSLVGALLRVGERRRPATWPAQRLAEHSRTGESVVAPPHPLTLDAVIYPPAADFAARAEQARARRDCEC